MYDFACLRRNLSYKIPLDEIHTDQLHQCLSKPQGKNYLELPVCRWMDPSWPVSESSHWGGNHSMVWSWFGYKKSWYVPTWSPNPVQAHQPQHDSPPMAHMPVEHWGVWGLAMLLTHLKHLLSLITVTRLYTPFIVYGCDFSTSVMGMFHDDHHNGTNDPGNGPLARYAKLRVRMRRECRERFPRHRGWAIPTCITARASPTCRDVCRYR